MKLKAQSRRSSLEWTLWIVAACFAGSAILAAPAAERLSHVGGATTDGSATLRFYDAGDAASPVLVRESEPYPARPTFWTSVHDGLFVAAGSTVYRQGRTPGDLRETVSWTAGEEILALADGPQRGLVLVLDRGALTLVRFPDDGMPTALWSEPLDLRGLPEKTGRLLQRQGNHVYLSDPTLPGVRVISIDPETEPVTIATYGSPSGPAHDLTLWGTTLVLLTEREVLVVDTGSIEHPDLIERGRYATLGLATSADVTSSHVFLADGADLLVLDLDPSHEDFLAAPLAFWVAPSEIRSVRLDRKGRAYVLLSDSWEVLDASAFPSR